MVSKQTPLSFTLNSKPVAVGTDAGKRLSTVLREQLGQLDVKIGCNAGDCGACTVLVNGLAVCACLTAASQVFGKQVDTLSGLVASESHTVSLQAAFLRHGAAQCGICTPGMLVSATALLQEQPAPSEQAVKDALGGVLCRCTGYRKIIDAVMDAGGHQAYRHDTAGTVSSRQSVGVSLTRLDGADKMNGVDAFGDDVAPANAKVLRVVRSPFHHATFELGDIVDFVARHDGVDRVLCADDIPGQNRFGIIPGFIDQPVFAEGRVRFRGEAVAAVVGNADVMEALDFDDFPVRWTEQAALMTPAEAQTMDAVQLHAQSDNNLMCCGTVQCGDADAGLENAYVKVSGRFSTGFIEHAYIEPEAGFAQRTGNTVEVHGCTQAAYMDRDSLALILGIDAEAVRIVPSAVGGGFGSKLDLSFQPFIAVAAWLLNTPVRIAYTRRESMQATTKRHPSDMQVSIGVDNTGRLCGCTFEGTFNTGAYASWGPTVANRVPIHASGPYLHAHYRARASGIYTHTAPAGAFRGFGVPQAAIAQESLFDELAMRMKMDRLEFRLLNALDNHQATVTGQVFEQSVGIRACLEGLRAQWRAADKDADAFNRQAIVSHSPWRRGIGIASGWYGCGNTSLSNPSTIKAGIRRDGTLVLHQGAIDLGQGSTTVITQLFADALGVAAKDVTLLGADTGITPDAGKTSASRQTFVSGNAARLAGLALRQEIARQSGYKEIVGIDLSASNITVTSATGERRSIDLADQAALNINDDGYVLMVEESYDPPTSTLDENGQGEPYAIFGYAAQMVVLDVDTQLGLVRLDHFVAAHDVGRAINPLLVEGQIHGGIAQGIGMALMEAFIPGRTENLHDYLIPTIGDVPPIETIIVEVPDPHGPCGAKGLGEHVLIPTAPAILNAIRDASGAVIRNLPATPDKVLAAIHRDVETE
ncbi:MAG: molybdopterin cofactor-binding domain-containing protein [Granulosicoccus sp.]